ncbi:hypothetical protein ACLOJK_029334 [Asimina triloba]
MPAVNIGPPRWHTIPLEGSDLVACEPALIFLIACRRRILLASVACSDRPRANDVEVALLAQAVECGCSTCPPRYPRLLESSSSLFDFALVIALLARVIVRSSFSTPAAVNSFSAASEPKIDIASVMHAYPLNYIYATKSVTAYPLRMIMFNVECTV